MLTAAFIESDDGPPIRGPCGASYRPSENFAVSSGHQPFVVEILVAAKGLANRDSQAKCLGTIVTYRHVLTVGKLTYIDSLNQQICPERLTFFEKMYVPKFAESSEQIC